MGNSASSATGSSNNRTSQPQSLNSSNVGGGSSNIGVRTPSISPGPGNPHHSLRTKKRSLELPDLASISTPGPYSAATAHLRGRSTGQQGQPQTPARSAAIAIPVSPPNPFNHYQHANEIEPVQRATVILPSQTDVRRGYQQMHLTPPEPTRTRAQRQQDKMERREREREQREYEQQQYGQTQQAYPRGRQQPASSSRQQKELMRIQELYDQSKQPPAPPSSPAGPGFDSSAPYTRRQRPKEIVRSSIPTILKAKEKEKAPEEVKAPVGELVLEPVPVKIVWKGGGTEVVLARAGDDDWKGRQSMQRDPVDRNIWSLTIDLLPGTHHVRFLVDNIWRVADDLPAAVDDQGSLANYVAVPIVPAASGGVPVAPTAAPTLALPKPLTTLTAVNATPASKNLVSAGHSFWSAESSADGDDDDLTSPRPPKIDISKHPHASPAAVAYIQATWTDVPPPELIEAAKEEEAYLHASAGQYDGSSTRVTGFVPAPNIPPAPGLPRYLDKLILNSKVGEQKVAVPGSNNSNAGSSPRRGGKKDGDNLGGVGSGQGGSKRERREREERRDREERQERREREREDRKEREHRERERERGERATRSRRGNVPPAPPPSETGDDDNDSRADLASYNTSAAKQSPYMPAQLLKQYAQPLNTAAGVQANIMGAYGGQSSSLPTGTSIGPGGHAGAAAAANPLASSSGGALAFNGGATVGGVVGGSGGTSAAPSTGTSGTVTPQQHSSGGPATPTGQLSPHQTPPTLAPQWGIVGNRTPGGMMSPTPAPSAYPAPPPLERAPLSGSRAITIDDANMPPLTDDNSVLPVPSHVVLHHLCTSAIRNGVLAVANTTRYRKKYLTTIYYKPT